MEQNIDLLDKARQDLIDDMADRGFGAILWDNATAGFHYIPEIILTDEEGEERGVTRVMGLYRYDDKLYLVEEDGSGVNFNEFYNHDTEVKPTIVTLSEETARKDLGDPRDRKGFTTEGTLEEWLGIADCYFEAVAEE